MLYDSHAFCQKYIFDEVKRASTLQLRVVIKPPMFSHEHPWMNYLIFPSLSLFI